VTIMMFKKLAILSISNSFQLANARAHWLQVFVGGSRKEVSLADRVGTQTVPEVKPHEETRLVARYRVVGHGNCRFEQLMHPSNALRGSSKLLQSL